jgi:hypothetical protein
VVRDELKPPSFAEHPVDGGEFLVNPAPSPAARGASLSIFLVYILEISLQDVV